MLISFLKDFFFSKKDYNLYIDYYDLVNELVDIFYNHDLFYQCYDYLEYNNTFKRNDIKIKIVFINKGIKVKHKIFENYKHIIRIEYIKEEFINKEDMILQ